MDERAVATAVHEAGAFLRADGADLVLVSTDPKTDRIHLELQLEDASCADCVLPPDALHETLSFTLGQKLLGEFELVLDDPRRSDS